MRAYDMGRPTAEILADGELRVTGAQSFALCPSDSTPCGNFRKRREVPAW